MVQKGVPYRTIARVTGHALTTVQAHAQTGRKAPRGRHPALFDRLPAEHLFWLVDNTPPGASIYDTLCAIIADAYHETANHGDDP